MQLISLLLIASVAFGANIRPRDSVREVDEEQLEIDPRLNELAEFLESKLTPQQELNILKELFALEEELEGQVSNSNKRTKRGTGLEALALLKYVLLYFPKLLLTKNPFLG